MQYHPQLRTGVAIFAALTAVLCQAQDQASKDATNKEAQARESKGIPARATPADYQVHAEAGKITVAAEFTEHSIATPEMVLSSEDYVAVEVCLFGPPETHLKISRDDFTLRINGKKSPLPAQPYVIVFHSLKDPLWEPPEKVEARSKTSINGGGDDKPDPSSPPPVVHIPIDISRGWEQHVQKAALPEGDRLLPEGGLLFFQYHGKGKSIHSVELVYSGPGGQAVLTLQ